MHTSRVINVVAALILFRLALVTGIAIAGGPADSTGSGSVPPRNSVDGGKATSPDAAATGDWSASVDGLRARLLVRFVRTREAGRDILVYVELQNQSNVGTPISLFYSADDNCSTTWSLTDHQGNLVAKTPIAIRRPVTPPYWIAVPFDSTLRLRASNGSVVSRTEKGSTFLLLPPSEFWTFPKNSQEELFLSCSFELKAPPATSDHSNVWQGKVTIPKVKISLHE